MCDSFEKSLFWVINRLNENALICFRNRSIISLMINDCYNDGFGSIRFVS